MNEHLTSEQITEWLAGTPEPETARHARECPRCRAEVESLREALAQFRESGRRWTAHHATNPAPARTRVRVVWVAAVAMAASTPSACA